MTRRFDRGEVNSNGWSIYGYVKVTYEISPVFRIDAGDTRQSFNFDFVRSWMMLSLLHCFF